MDHLMSSARAAGLPLERLMIQVTETALLPGNPGYVEESLVGMSRQGLKIAIDDFGTGYSSLARLSNGWVDALKIDSSFVQNMVMDSHAQKLVASIVQLARTLELEPLANGVESDTQRRLLLEAGCTLGQGLLFSGALEAGELAAFLRPPRETEPNTASRRDGTGRPQEAIQQGREALHPPLRTPPA
jgi:EAL domain-containing protein (putative c-di-GMP-specific phosphodiesterase class I)